MLSHQPLKRIKVSASLRLQTPSRPTNSNKGSPFHRTRLKFTIMSRRSVARLNFNWLRYGNVSGSILSYCFGRCCSNKSWGHNGRGFRTIWRCSKGVDNLDSRCRMVRLSYTKVEKCFNKSSIGAKYCVRVSQLWRSVFFFSWFGGISDCRSKIKLYHQSHFWF